ncbi:hypothetical protein [Legionella tunisiensis]|uniref:hypothetical protein n=1 Tax=Legionella tunisiensis TaxID=1034944 RepID=UPI000379B381|nr:hypothetical protein [Legionella tunisiensis]
MNKNARCYYEAALKLLLPVEETPEIEGFTLKLGKKTTFFTAVVLHLIIAVVLMWHVINIV